MVRGDYIAAFPRGLDIVGPSISLMVLDYVTVASTVVVSQVGTMFTVLKQFFQFS